MPHPPSRPSRHLDTSWTTRVLSTVATCCLALLAACSEQHDQSSPVEASRMTMASLSLTGTVWQVEDIDQGGIVDASMVTIRFPEDGRIAGGTGCNKFFGAAVISGESISISGIGVTQMACAEALMAQERRFLNALQNANRLEMDNNTWLVFYDATRTERLRAIGVVEQPEAVSEAKPELLDQAKLAGLSFTCENAGIAAVRFLGPDTVELKFKGETYQLPLERSASGAKYTVDNVTFWNKGNEAMIEINSERYTCVRNTEEK